MRVLIRRFLFIAVFFSSYFISHTAVHSETQTQPVTLRSSTQYLWGDDLLGQSQNIIAQYLMFGIKPEGQKYSIVGYVRGWKDFTDSQIRSDDASGRIYLLYLDYVPFEDVSFRLGRQFINFSAGSSLLDGLSVNLSKLGPIGVTIAAGNDVRFSLDSEYSQRGFYFAGIDVHLVNVRATQLGVSYVMKYDDYDRAREELGLNFRRSFSMFSPYAEIRYDHLSETFDQITAGIDVYPVKDLSVKAEFYQSYPTFDSTSIYSVFAVDKYRDFLVRAEYSLNSPVTVYTSYAQQDYEEGAIANNYVLGSKFHLTKSVTLDASIDDRTGFGGQLWGFDVHGDYKVMTTLTAAAGIQYDSYMRPDQTGASYAKRFWIGGQWIVKPDMALNARVEDDVNESFHNRFLGRITLDWNL